MESIFSTTGFLLGAANNTGFSWTQIFTLWVPIIFIFYMLMIRPQRKEQQQRESKLKAIAKHDRILTIGGIFGVVSNVNHQKEEITVKVDDVSNTKLRMTLGSIAQVIGDEKHQQQRGSKHKEMKQNDRVLTIGGIYGVVSNVNHEEDEITIKVDEMTNTKLHMTIGSISRVIGDESKNN